MKLGDEHTYKTPFHLKTPDWNCRWKTVILDHYGKFVAECSPDLDGERLATFLITAANEKGGVIPMQTSSDETGIVLP